MDESEATFLTHCACDKCGSSDANSLYSDGHQFCFNCEAYIAGRNDAPTPPPTSKSRSVMADFLKGEYRALGKRGINEDTCKKFGYQVGTHHHKAVQIANYRRDGQQVAQKIRYANKDFTVVGDLKHAGLYGQHLWSPTRRVVITEGEIDCLSVAQVLDLKWPVVSVPNGAQGAKKAIAREMEWLEAFDEVVLMFDTDEPGQKAAHACALMFTPGKCKIATLAAKDPNELLVAGKAKEIVQAIWNAKVYRPDGIVTMADVRERALQPAQAGIPWPWPALTEFTHGRRYGEVYGLGAGTGIGKTDVFTQIIKYTAIDCNEKCGVFYLEQPAHETAKRIAGKLAGKLFHVPDAGWTNKELIDSIKQIEDSGNLFMYDSFGSADWDTLLAKMKYLVHTEGVKHIFLDHLTALAAEADDERIELERIMSQMSKFAEANGIIFYFVSHLATPEGKPHEEGGRVTVRHFKGSRAIGFWSHFLFGLERSQQDGDETQRHTTTFRVLKDRYTGQATGKTFLIKYDAITGLLHEAEPQDVFEDETDSDSPPF